MAAILDSLESLVWKLLAEFVPALGADVVASVVFGPRSKGGSDALKKAADLAAAGKKDEAMAVLRPHFASGVGMEDEMIFISDLCALLRGGLVTGPQALALANFIAGLSQENRSRFRAAHTKEPNHTIRYANLVQLATLTNDAERTAFLMASGLLDRSPIEQILADLNTRAAAANVALDAQVAAKQAAFHAPLPRLTLRQWLLSWLNFNPLQ
jgi:hypothetical protein